ncbi:MAG: pyridoxamine 5'-phosphate oxidase family protein [Sinomicrobium sp.]|nr:pyridoxamine 5'-phosphate oxidase family protein [Sinomicrobium sp.]
MMLTPDIKNYIDRSVLCWLATVSADNVPNVSPKETFTYYGDTHIIIANIASPQTVRNIKQNSDVCISFVDVFVQKGYQLKGKACLVRRSDPGFALMEAPLLKFTEGKFPFSTITSVVVEQAKPIVAPRYVLYPGTTERQQIASAMKTYGVAPYPPLPECSSTQDPV